jgi:hypothetical protein
MPTCGPAPLDDQCRGARRQLSTNRTLNGILPGLLHVRRRSQDAARPDSRDVEMALCRLAGPRT